MKIEKVQRNFEENSPEKGRFSTTVRTGDQQVLTGVYRKVQTLYEYVSGRRYDRNSGEFDVTLWALYNDTCQVSES